MQEKIELFLAHRAFFEAGLTFVETASARQSAQASLALCSHLTAAFPLSRFPTFDIFIFRFLEAESFNIIYIIIYIILIV